MNRYYPIRTAITGSSAASTCGDADDAFRGTGAAYSRFAPGCVLQRDGRILSAPLCRPADAVYFCRQLSSARGRGKIYLSVRTSPYGIA
jgi:hypothetical protein